MVIASRVKSSEYHDSVTLMLVARVLLDLPGVVDAAVVMGTAANREILAGAGLLDAGAERAQPDDLVIVVKAEDDEAATATLDEADRRLTQRAERTPVGQARRLRSNDHFFLNLSMPAMKAMLNPAANIPGCTVVTVMARNGTDFGIRLSGTGDRWYVCQAGMPAGLWLPGLKADDANRDIGDSAITETGGIGGFAMAGAPAIVNFVGGAPDDGLNATLEMYEITAGEHSAFTIPALNFRGTPVGVDVRKVMATGILPRINTGIAHKDPGVGMVGAGLLQAPKECFVSAFEAAKSGASSNPKES